MQIITGIVLFLIGYIIRVLVIRQLKSNFTLHLDNPTHIVKTGWFRYIRHPSYLGTIIMFLGITLICTQLAIVYFVIVFLVSRIVEEEKILIAAKGEIYTDYMKKTGRLIPKFRRKLK